MKSLHIHGHAVLVDAQKNKRTMQLDDWLEIDKAKFALAHPPVLPIYQSYVPSMLELHAEILIGPETDCA